ncbi:hypothetical protein B0H13DRAFT_1040479 [Mycena leptocephala]|nr:hypothetical protein B0H13DRAFT_1040479 [Mycena leptocephala]
MKFILLSAVLAAVSITHVKANLNCTGGIHYCGHDFEGIGFDNWQPILFQATLDAKKAGHSVGPDTIRDSIYVCTTDSSFPGYVEFHNFCGQNRCVNGGPNEDDYCVR